MLSNKSKIIDKLKLTSSWWINFVMIFDYGNNYIIPFMTFVIDHLCTSIIVFPILNVILNPLSIHPQKLLQN